MRHSSHYFSVETCRSSVQSNLFQIRCANESARVEKVGICLRLSQLNVRSVNNKEMVIKEITVDSDIDILALTERWLHE